MTANELIHKLQIAQGNNNVDELTPEVIDMLRQQENEIKELKFLLKNLILATNKKMEELEKELNDCTCQGGHSEAYLKAKGRL
jgi:hypothetical protein